MEANNTGQWYWFPVTRPDYAGIGSYIIVEADGTTVCNPSPMGQDAAYLIAAAPAMLAALQRLTHPMADDTDLAHALVARMRTSGHAKFSPGWFDRGNKGCYYWTELTPIVYDQFTQEGHDNE